MDRATVRLSGTLHEKAMSWFRTWWGSGKTSIEVTREQIKETYAYEGALEKSALIAGLMDKDVEITCKDNGKGYTEVEYVNAPGSKGKGFKRLKEVPEDKMAKLAAMWSGKSSESKNVDPKVLFADMAGKA